MQVSEMRAFIRLAWPLKPGTSAVAAITSDALFELSKSRSCGRYPHGSEHLAAEISAMLDEGKNVALGVLLVRQVGFSKRWLSTKIRLR